MRKALLLLHLSDDGIKSQNKGVGGCARIGTLTIWLQSLDLWPLHYTALQNRKTNDTGIKRNRLKITHSLPSLISKLGGFNWNATSCTQSRQGAIISCSDFSLPHELTSLKELFTLTLECRVPCKQGLRSYIYDSFSFYLSHNLY